MMRTWSECIEEECPDGGHILLNHVGSPAEQRPRSFWQSRAVRGRNTTRKIVADDIHSGKGLLQPTNHVNLGCLSYPKSFGPLMTLPCAAQCNIEMLRVALLRLQPVKRYLPSPRLLLASQQLGGGETLSRFPNATLSATQTALCVFQRVVMATSHLIPSRQSRVKLATTDPFCKKYASAVHILAAR